MRILELEQGTDPWKEHRKSARNASEAPIILGASDKTKRSELVKMKALGTEKEYSAWVEEVLFENGHKVEALARPIAEGIIGQEIYPVTAESDDGFLSASFDGITMDESIVWECKQWNEAKAADVSSGKIPEVDYWQAIQQLSVSGSQRLLYMVTDGSPEKTVHVWLERPADVEFQTLIEGWKVFDEDVANYVHEDQAVAPTGKAPESIPALRIEVTGMVTASNLDLFKERALATIGAINRDLQTDQHFADAEKAIKWCKDVEDRLAAAKQHALSQTASIDELFRAIDEIGAEARQARLELDKLVKKRKEDIRSEIAMDAAAQMAAHIEQINATLGGKIRMPAVLTDFPGAMKGKKTVASLKDAASTELARAKIEANQIADKIRINLDILRAETEGHESLFPDAQQLVGKETEDLKNLIKTRIADHLAEASRREQASAQEQEKPEPSGSPALVKAAPKPLRSTQTKEQAPSGDEILAVLVSHYGVSRSQILAWLRSIDLSDAPF